MITLAFLILLLAVGAAVLFGRTPDSRDARFGVGPMLDGQSRPDSRY
jgi:hypothetical protein